MAAGSCEQCGHCAPPTPRPTTPLRVSTLKLLLPAASHIRVPHVVAVQGGDHYTTRHATARQQQSRGARSTKHWPPTLHCASESPACRPNCPCPHSRRRACRHTGTRSPHRRATVHRADPLRQCQSPGRNRRQHRTALSATATQQPQVCHLTRQMTACQHSTHSAPRFTSRILVLACPACLDFPCLAVPIERPCLSRQRRP